MRWILAEQPPSDRAGERDPSAVALRKPPVLSRATQRLLCLFCLALVIYGTLGPLYARKAAWIARPAAWQWIPAARPTDFNDVVTNVLVYVPVGAAFRLLVRRRGATGPLDLLAAMLLSVALSSVTELLQQFTPGRVSSLLDICVNTGGALSGALLAVPFQALLRRVHHGLYVRVHLRGGAWDVVTVAALLATIVLMTTPWTLHRPDPQRVQAASLKLSDPLWALRLLAFGGVGFLVAGREMARGRTSRRAFVVGSAALTTLAVVLEASQAVLSAHVANVMHAGVATLGGTLGALVAVRFGPGGGLSPQAADAARAAAAPFPREESGLAALAASPRLRIVAGVAVCLLVLAIVVTGVRPSHAGGLRTPPLTVNWVPFRAHFAAPFLPAVTDLCAKMALYALLALLCLLVSRGRGASAALLLTLGVVGVVESARLLFNTRPAETTSAVLALIAWAVAVRGWRAFRPAPCAAAAATARTAQQPPV